MPTLAKKELEVSILLNTLKDLLDKKSLLWRPCLP